MRFFASQLVTSATNFTVSFFLARSLTIAEFGFASLALLLVYFVVAFQRAAVGDALLVFVTDDRRLGEAGSLIALINATWVAGALCAVSLSLNGHVPLALAPAAFMLLLQDGLRYVWVSRGRTL